MQKPWLNWVIGIAFGLICIGLVFWLAAPQRGDPVTLLPPPTPVPIIVHVTGAVNQPGVFSLPVGSRVMDAITAAGGLMPAANTSNINLAARLEDGMKINIPSVSPTPEPGTAEISSTPAARSADPVTLEETPPSLVNINTAEQAALESLPGIGPALAQRIISYREENGPFKVIEDIQNVTGIGPAKFEQIKDKITIQD